MDRADGPVARTFGAAMLPSAVSGNSTRAWCFVHRRFCRNVIRIITSTTSALKYLDTPPRATLSHG